MTLREEMRSILTELEAARATIVDLQTAKVEAHAAQVAAHRAAVRAEHPGDLDRAARTGAVDERRGAFKVYGLRGGSRRRRGAQGSPQRRADTRRGRKSAGGHPVTAKP